MPTDKRLDLIEDVVAEEVRRWIAKQGRPVSWLEIQNSINAADPTTQVKDALRRLMAQGEVRTIKGESTTVLYEIGDDDEIPF